jgi:hypothetical protein
MLKKVLSGVLLALPLNVFAQGALENPGNGGVASGIGLFSGWVCDAEVVEIMIDGAESIPAAYGTSREDTRSICGDANNGFGLLYNFGILASGVHQAVAFADGVEIGRTTFTTTRLSTGEFLAGASSFGVLRNFPSEGRELWLEWSQGNQNFIITNEQATPNPYDVEGGWVNNSLGLVVSINTKRVGRNTESIAALAAATNGPWQAFQGTIQGDTAFLNSFPGYSPAVSMTVRWQSATRMRVFIDSCSPSFQCALQTGDVIDLVKEY